MWNNGRVNEKVSMLVLYKVISNIPISARNNCYREFNSYIYGLGD